MIQLGNQLFVTPRPGPEGNIVTLQGFLDGTFDPTRWPLEPGALLVDAGALTGADVAGLARWKALLSLWGPREAAFLQLRLPPAQAEILVGPHALVSVVVPTRCSQCRTSSDAVFDLRIAKPALGGEDKGPPCPRCDAPTLLDPGARALAAPWVARPPPVLPSRVAVLWELLPEHGIATEHALVVRQDTATPVTALWVQGPLTDAALLPRKSAATETVLVTHGVTGADPLGVRALLEWLKSASEVTVVGLPIVLLRGLAREARAFSGVVASMTLRLDCSAGHVLAVDVGSAGLIELQRVGRLAAQCPECLAVSEVTLSAEAQTSLGRLSTGTPTASVASYLQRPAPRGLMPRPRSLATAGSAFDAESDAGSSADLSSETLSQRQELFGSADEVGQLSDPNAGDEGAEPETPSWRMAAPSLPARLPTGAALRVIPARPPTASPALPAPPPAVNARPPSRLAPARPPTLTPARVAMPAEWAEPELPTLLGQEEDEETTDPALSLSTLKPR